MMHAKAIWKSGIAETGKAFGGFVPGPHKGGLQWPRWTPNCIRPNLLIHEKASILREKNLGQQKGLDKAQIP